jgi:nucleotide-binding universal stress UspA family protein
MTGSRPPFPRILCAVDGSDASDTAVAQALTLAGTDAPLTRLIVAGPDGMPHPDQALTSAIRAAADAGVTAEVLIRRATDVPGTIMSIAGSFDLLVLGAPARHGGIVTVALRHASQPVLVARPAPQGTVFPRDIMVATDGSPAMRPALRVTAALARRHAARVVLLHAARSDAAIERELADEAVTLLRATGHEPVVIELAGRPLDRIAGLAAELPVSLIITGSRMLTGLHALASVSARAGTTAPCSVLVLRGPSWTPQPAAAN